MSSHIAMILTSTQTNQPTMELTMKFMIIPALLTMFCVSFTIPGNTQESPNVTQQSEQIQSYRVAGNQTQIGEVCQCNDGTTCGGYGRIGQNCMCTTYTGNIRVTHWGQIVPLNR
jgi:hypothetical protein